VRLSDGLGKAQRIVVVIAFGMALGAVGSYLVNLGNTVRAGWYAYAPLTQAVYPPRTGLAGWLRLIIWLALIGLWAVVSVRLLRPSPQERTPE
jgi:heme/copper-type cytochrome/quinol oxidase subunit 1